MRRPCGKAKVIVLATSLTPLPALNWPFDSAACGWLCSALMLMVPPAALSCVPPPTVVVTVGVAVAVAE